MPDKVIEIVDEYKYKLWQEMMRRISQSPINLMPYESTHFLSNILLCSNTLNKLI